MCCLVFDVALTQSSKMTICNNIILLWTQLLLIVTVLLILDIKCAPKKYLKNFRKGVLPSCFYKTLSKSGGGAGRSRRWALGSFSCTHYMYALQIGKFTVLWLIAYKKIITFWDTKTLTRKEIHYNNKDLECNLPPKSNTNIINIKSRMYKCLFL